MQPLTVGSGKGGAEWTRGSSRETGDGGFGERTERAVARTLMLSHPPYCRSHLAQADHASLSGISLKQSNSPTPR